MIKSSCLFLSFETLLVKFSREYFLKSLSSGKFLRHITKHFFGQEIVFQYNQAFYTSKFMNLFIKTLHEPPASPIHSVQSL